MLFSAMRTYAALRFRDTSNQVVADNDWKTYINDAYGDMLSRCTWFPWNEASSQLTVTASTREIALPADVWQVTAVWDTINFYPLVPLEGRDQVFSEYPQQNEVGSAMHYRIFNNKLQVYPMPSVNTPYVVEYISRPADLVADGDSPVFPDTYHTTVVEGAVALAYRDDGNLQMAGAFEAAYEAQVAKFLVDLMQPRNSRYYEPVDNAL
jgi:hypothetical protein